MFPMKKKPTMGMEQAGMESPQHGMVRDKMLKSSRMPMKTTSRMAMMAGIQRALKKSK